MAGELVSLDHDRQLGEGPEGVAHRGLRLYGQLISELIHTCYRILDIDRSVSFYEKLGFEEIGRMPIRDEAINVFMGLPDDGPRLELTYNVGREEPYEIGTGYGHIAVSVDDLDATLERLAELGIEPERPPYTVREGGSRLCFVATPTVTVAKFLRFLPATSPARRPDPTAPAPLRRAWRTAA